MTSWRRDALAALADAEALDSARDIVLGAEREARRLVRGARREVTDARAHLDELERFGVATRRQVAELRAGGWETAAAAAPADPPEPPEPIRVRKGRATLHDSPLAELFRVTAPPA